MAYKEVIKPVYDEWWAKGPIVAANDQQRKDIELAFYAGCYVAMGLIARANKLDKNIAENMAQAMIEECRCRIMPKKFNFKASIDGQPIDN